MRACVLYDIARDSQSGNPERGSAVAFPSRFEAAASRESRLVAEYDGYTSSRGRETPSCGRSAFQAIPFPQYVGASFSG